MKEAAKLAIRNDSSPIELYVGPVIPEQVQQFQGGGESLSRSVGVRAWEVLCMNKNSQFKHQDLS